MIYIYIYIGHFLHLLDSFWKQANRREMGMTHSKGSLPVSNQGHHGYMACKVTSQLPGHAVEYF